MTNPKRQSDYSFSVFNCVRLNVLYPMEDKKLCYFKYHLQWRNLWHYFVQICQQPINFLGLMKINFWATQRGKVIIASVYSSKWHCLKLHNGKCAWSYWWWKALFYFKSIFIGGIYSIFLSKNFSDSNESKTSLWLLGFNEYKFLRQGDYSFAVFLQLTLPLTT